MKRFCPAEVSALTKYIDSLDYLYKHYITIDFKPSGELSVTVCNVKLNGICQVSTTRTVALSHNKVTRAKQLETTIEWLKYNI